MSKKNETSIVKVDDLMNKVIESTADTQDEVIDCTAIKEVLKQNEENLTEINKYFKDMALGYKAEQTIINPPENIQTKIDNIVLELQNVIQQYLKQLPRYGITAYWKSKGSAKYLKNEYCYFGHCFAFDKKITDCICSIVEELIEWGLDYIMTGIRIFLEAFLDKEIVDAIIHVLYAIIAAIVEDLENLKKSRAGIMIFYFDRVDMLTKFGDYIDLNLQPSIKWIPDKYYDQEGWNLIWKKK
jgi:hypothetical protein